MQNGTEKRRGDGLDEVRPSNEAQGPYRMSYEHVEYLIPYLGSHAGDGEYDVDCLS